MKTSGVIYLHERNPLLCKYYLSLWKVLELLCISWICQWSHTQWSSFFSMIVECDARMYYSHQKEHLLLLCHCWTGSWCHCESFQSVVAARRNFWWKFFSSFQASVCSSDQWSELIKTTNWYWGENKLLVTSIDYLMGKFTGLNIWPAGFTIWPEDWFFLLAGLTFFINRIYYLTSRTDYLTSKNNNLASRINNLAEKVKYFVSRSWVWFSDWYLASRIYHLAGIFNFFLFVKGLSIWPPGFAIWPAGFAILLTRLAGRIC